MRLWTLHPCYLDARGLVALWREALLAQHVLRGRTVGYRRHPQLRRFREHRAPVACIGRYLDAVWLEAQARGYRFDRSKIVSRRRAVPLTETTGQLRYEWKHLRAKLRARAPSSYRDIRLLARPRQHPLFRLVPGGVRQWERVPAGAAARPRANTMRPKARARSRRH